MTCLCKCFYKFTFLSVDLNTYFKEKVSSTVVIMEEVLLWSLLKLKNSLGVS